MGAPVKLRRLSLTRLPKGFRRRDGGAEAVARAKEIGARYLEAVAELVHPVEPEQCSSGNPVDRSRPVWTTATVGSVQLFGWWCRRSAPLPPSPPLRDLSRKLVVLHEHQSHHVHGNGAPTWKLSRKRRRRPLWSAALVHVPWARDVPDRRVTRYPGDPRSHGGPGSRSRGRCSHSGPRHTVNCTPSSRPYPTRQPSWRRTVLNEILPEGGSSSARCRASRGPDESCAMTRGACAGKSTSPAKICAAVMPRVGSSTKPGSPSLEKEFTKFDLLIVL